MLLHKLPKPDFSSVNPLRIIFLQDGIEFGGKMLDRYEWESFKKAIIHIGIDKIRKTYNPSYDGEALILDKKHSSYPEASKELNSHYFLNTHGGAEHFKRVLEDVAEKIKIGIKVEILK